MKPQLVQRIEISGEIRCDIINHKNVGKRAHLYPVSPSTYWSTHRDINLTRREVQGILDELGDPK